MCIRVSQERGFEHRSTCKRTCKEPRVELDQTSCSLRPPILGTPSAPSGTSAATGTGAGAHTNCSSGSDRATALTEQHLGPPLAPSGRPTRPAWGAAPWGPAANDNNHNDK